MMSEGTNQVAGPGQDIRDNQDDFDPVNASASGVIDDLPAWILSLTAVARTGLAFSDSLYERERYEEILKVVARMQEAAGARDRGVDTSVFAEGPRGIPGYVTPKTAVGAIVLDASRRVLLIRRADSGVWLYPTGWADVGYSPAEVVVKEVQEETGVHCTPTHLLAVLDGMRLGFTQVAMYSSIFSAELMAANSLRTHLRPPVLLGSRSMTYRPTLERCSQHRGSLGSGIGRNHRGPISTQLGRIGCSD